MSYEATLSCLFDMDASVFECSDHFYFVIPKMSVKFTISARILDSWDGFDVF